MLSKILFVPVALAAAAAAQTNSSSSTIVCVAGQCLQGTVNTTLGGTLSVPPNPSILLLPGQYTSASQPDLLHEALSTSQSSLSLSPGFSNSSSSQTVTPSLPLTIAVQPGLLSFPERLYQGAPSYTVLPSNRSSLSSTSITPGSFLPAPNTWAAFTSSASRLIIWDAIPDFSQLPPASISNSFVLSDIQSAACNPTCASTGHCTPSGICACAPGFTGTSCETCEEGFFGPNCEACPANCTKCDEGLTGTGKCLVPEVTNAPSSCSCLNGVCGSGGTCTCNTGWTKSNNGTACATCAPGFFLNSNGNCEVCGIGCTQCSDGTGQCTTCATGLTQDAQDRTTCVAVTTGSTQCPDTAFNSNGTCQLCSSACQTCTGPSSNNCIICAAGQFMNNGQCVSADATGVCAGTKLFANTLKKECDSCPAKCTSCNIPNFTGASTPDTVQCTGCLPGFFLSKGQCIPECPSGTFIASDGFTCSTCDSSCTACTGSSTFCLSCSSSKLASNGTCITSCPSSTFSSTGSCLSCHPDCATCSGSGFNQCLTCPSSLPVLSNGRCLPTCAKNEFLDSTGKCTTCDASCSSCAGPGANQCLACAATGTVLTGGTCTKATCTSSTSVVPGLGVCLSQLVKVADPAASPAPLPTFTAPAPTQAAKSGTGSIGRRLTWWEILLMALGCAFIFVVFMWLWRRHARKKRAQKTATFARRLDQKAVWRRRFARFAELFSRKKKNHSPARDGLPMHEMGWVKESEYDRLMRMREEEAARHALEMGKLESAYAKSFAEGKVSRQPSIKSKNDVPTPMQHHLNVHLNVNPARNPNRTSAPSLYSQLTGLPRNGPEPKQPTRDLDLDLERGDRLLSSRFSVTTAATSVYPRDHHPEALPPMPTYLTDAEAYAAVHKPKIETVMPTPPLAQHATSYWIVPADNNMLIDAPLVDIPIHNTGSSAGSSNVGSRNPFRR
ncbi:hypothetical protein M422DRAFT_35819 [Sphaerobolus stellatus SS14]|uniref:Unplaced genomic scaffold SPHSTscaffold_152, whole genome shotgun sequence n=1 Tax=Sphaerobolus stellatus (strain SS14) TaxID=990650 RepID=A0A0C9V4T9_SPHS4|nr:hypothetical protein M422DRAFT_35819 [Sphaerobolus stellatus SS14]